MENLGVIPSGPLRRADAIGNPIAPGLWFT